jgi:hypothetical protein
MDQQSGWEPTTFVSARDLDSGKKARGYRYEFDTEPGTNSLFRRTARAKANRLNAKAIVSGRRNVVFLAEKRKRGPAGWHVVKRTKVPV